MYLNSLGQNNASLIREYRNANKNIAWVLSESSEQEIIETQEQFFLNAVKDHKISRKEGLSSNLKHQQDTGELYKMLQIAFSDSQYFFEDNHSSKAEKIKEVVIIPSRLPESFLKQFKISEIKDDAQNIKDIFKEAKPLWYMDQAKGKYTNRVLFHKGKIMIFRTVKTLLFEEDPRTVGEKRKYDTNKYMNVYGTIYDAIRSQKYIIEEQTTNANDLKDLQKTIVELIQEIKLDTKDGEIGRKLDTILDEIQNAKSHHIVAANINNLSNIVGQHAEREKNHLIGAKNKFSKRIADLKQYVAAIDIQTNEMENILQNLQYATEMLHSRVLGNVRSDGSGNKQILAAFERYFNEIEKIPYLPDPFAQFVNTFKSMSNIQNAYVKDIILAIVLQRLSLDIMKCEHEVKSGKKEYTSVDVLELMETLQRFSNYYQDGYGELISLLFDHAKQAQNILQNPDKDKESIRKHFNTLKGIHTFIKTIH